MNSRERVLSVFRGETPDRVPWGEFAVDFDTIEKIIGRETYLRAKARSQIGFWEGKRAEIAASWARDAIDFYRAMPQLDMVTFAAATWQIGPPDARPDAPKKVDENTWRFDDGRVMKYSDVTRDITMVEDPLEWTRPFRAENYPLPGEPNWKEPKPPDPACFEVIDAVISEFRGERFIAGACGGEIGNPFFGGMQRGMVELIEEPDLVERMVKHDCARQCEADAWNIRDGQDGVLTGADFAYNSGPYISPENFRRFVTPYAKQRVDAVHAHGQLFLKHACGNNEKILDQFCEIGYDCYQSLQLSAGMDLEKVRSLVGPDMVLWGNLPLEVLQSGTADEVRTSVREIVEKGKRVGRFIFGTSHSVAVGTPYENFMATMETFEEVRDY